MNFDWQSYLALAEHLKDSASAATSPSDVVNTPLTPTAPGHIEAYYRSSASRAYYSVYHLAKDAIYKKDGESFEDVSSSHQALYLYLMGDRRPGRSKIGRNLQRLHQLRCRADYDSDLKEMPANLASKAFSEARKIAADITRTLAS